MPMGAYAPRIVCGHSPPSSMLSPERGEGENLSQFRDRTLAFARESQ